MFDLPLEYALIEFEDAKSSGKVVPELVELAARGNVRYVDIVFIQKEDDGTTRTLELNDLDPETYDVFVPIGEHVSSIFTTDDPAIAASRLPASSAAMLILWENLWVADLRKALLDAGGTLVERAQITPEVVEEFEKGARRGLGRTGKSHCPHDINAQFGGSIMRGRRGVNPPGPVGGVGRGRRNGVGLLR